MAVAALKQMQQQFTTVLEGLSRKNVELQAELEDNRQAAVSALAALRQELRTPQRVTSAAVGVNTRLLGKLGEFSGAQEAWRDWSAVFKGYPGAAVPRLQKLMEEAKKADVPIPNAAILEEDEGSIGTALLDVAHDLQGFSSEHRDPGGRQRRTVDREVRAEDANTVRRMLRG